MDDPHRGDNISMISAAEHILKAYLAVCWPQQADLERNTPSSNQRAVHRVLCVFPYLRLCLAVHVCVCVTVRLCACMYVSAGLLFAHIGRALNVAMIHTRT